MLERIHTTGVTLKEAIAPNQEEIPDDKKAISYPFDLAWEKSMKERKNQTEDIKPLIIKNENLIAVNNEKIQSVDCKMEEKIITESMDALKVLSIQCPIECDSKNNVAND